MAKSRATGVGRGNGAGSASTQYKAGQPSANSKGRPRRVKASPTSDVVEAFARELAKTIEISENGKPRKVTQAEAMAASAMSLFPKASLPQMLQLLRYLTTINANQPVRPSPPADKRKFLEQLGETLKRSEEFTQRYNPH